MLKQIYIRNFALIDDLEIELTDNLNIFTGETGSGKSIIIDAISYALGKRADKNFVRKNMDKAIIELVFFVEKESKSFLENKLNLEGIQIQDGIIVLKREIFSDGRSLCKINSRNVTATFVKSISNYLINIHGQNEFGELEDENQINILDNYIGMYNEESFKQYQDVYSKYVNICNKIFEMKEKVNHNSVDREKELLLYQIDDIENAALKENELEDIENRIDILQESEEINQTLKNLYDDFYGSDNNILKKIGKYIDIIRKYEDLDENLKNISTTLNDNYYSLEDISRESLSLMENFYYDQDEYNNLIKRNDELNKIYRKYGSSYDEVMDFYKKIKQKLEDLENLEDNLIIFEKEKSICEEQMNIYCSKISQLRISKAKTLEKELLEQLKSLGMVDTEFNINITTLGNFRKNGLDNVKFYVSFNKGEDLKPFSKVASGGEISRFMLGLKAINSNEYKRTMIFDEIDTGISGVASERLSEKLREISSMQQVICITHLPQVAASAYSHYKIYKEQQDNQTFTRVNKLNDAQRVEEIAKMMDGEQASQKSLEYANELILKKINKR